MIVMNHDGDLFDERRKKDRRRVERRKNEDSSRDRRKNDRRIVNINDSKKK